MKCTTCKNTSKIKLLITTAILFGIVFLTLACSTRGINDTYDGATAQRLVTHSLDKLVSLLPEKDFMPFANRKVYAKYHFIKNDFTLSSYAMERIRMELLNTYSCKLTDKENEAEAVFDFFFTALGTDRDKAGFKTPEFIVPGGTGSASIDLVAIDMFHGISELYYYITTKKDNQTTKGPKLKAISKTDSLALPIITIPINSLK